MALRIGIDSKPPPKPNVASPIKAISIVTIAMDVVSRGKALI